MYLTMNRYSLGASVRALDDGPTYASIFRPWKYRPVRLLEIGIGGYGESPGGASLLSWQAFFPFGRIIGADIEDKSALTGWRRDILNLDQSSPTQLTALSRNLAPFDIIIDDGSHLNAHQLNIEHLFAALKDGGIYVVEDVQTSFWPGAVGRGLGMAPQLTTPGSRTPATATSLSYRNISTRQSSSIEPA